MIPRAALSLIMLIPLCANAGLIATAHGVVSSGCHNCEDATGYDIFGLGPNADLAGYTFSIEFLVSDQLLARPPTFNASDGSAIRWLAGGNVADYMHASISLNGHKYQLPDDSAYITYFGYHSDGRETLYLADEDTGSRDGGNAFNVNILDATEDGRLHFRSLSRGPSVPTHLTELFGTIGQITVRPEHVVVPEPSTLSMLAIGALYLGFAPRRRNGQRCRARRA